MRYVALVYLALGAQAASAQQASLPPTPEALVAAYRCAEVQGDGARLACYDEAVGRLREAEAQGQIVAVDHAQAANIEREAFGFNLPNLARLIPRLGAGDNAQAEIEGVEMQIDRIARRADGKSRFIMSNGQAWSQTEPQSMHNVRAGDTVRVRRAALGTFMLVGSRGGAGHRVRREG